MQEQIKKEIEELVNEEIIFEENQEFHSDYFDNSSVVDELKNSYNKLKNSEPKNLLEKAKNLFNEYVLQKEEPSLGEQKQKYVNDLERVARECSKSLVKGSKARKQIQQLEEKITESLLNDKDSFLKTEEYIRKLDDAIAYTEEELTKDYSLETESILRTQLNQLKNKREVSYRKIDQLSIRANQIAIQKKQISEYLIYADTQNQRISQSLQIAEYTVAFLNATDGINEYLKAGSYAAQLNEIFEASKEMIGERDDLFINALGALGNLVFQSEENFDLEKANSEASEKLRKDRTNRISSARNVFEAL